MSAAMEQRPSTSTLFDTLSARVRPEDVAEMILGLPGQKWTAAERATLETAARHSLKRGLRRATSMTEEFRQAVPPERQVRTAEALFHAKKPLSAAECADAEIVRALVVRLARSIRATIGALDFKRDRLNREARRKARLGKLSRRRYNKLFRLLSRFETKLDRYVRDQRVCAAGMMAKSGLVAKLSRQAFGATPEAACFVAYYTARRNRRSVFTNVGQESAFDKIAEMLLARVVGGWFAVAHAFPEHAVVEHLNARQKTALLVLSLKSLRELAELLREVWKRSKFDRASMVVSRGDDSSTWNALAGAWNAARQSYFALLRATGAEGTLDSLCIGKVMRLMAADVAYWHRSSGGDLDPNTFVWANLPAPWEVLSGDAICTRGDVARVCNMRGMNPHATGWLPAARARERVAVSFAPTPELVHGVAISSPELAATLRKCGWFSGKSVRCVCRGR
jgi:hypothetical protein